MFRASQANQQTGFFDSEQLLTVKMRKRLEQSWAQTFREQVLIHLPEEAFAVLFSEQDSRPNASIQVIVGGDLLKSGFGWTDEELAEHIGFDLLTRHALGLDDLGEEGPTLRTVYNLRRRVREYAEETGINLYGEVFARITAEQIGQLAIKTEWQRMDSTQLLSNIACLNRLELVLAVLQKGVKGLSAEQQQVWRKNEAAYLSKPAQNVCYRLKASDTEGHLVRVGELLLSLVNQLEAQQGAESLIKLVARTLDEQYELLEENTIKLKANTDIAADSLQSPHDPQATYRHKNEQSYKGYVAHLSETCDPENKVQLITSVQTAPNSQDEAQLLADTLTDLSSRQIPLTAATVDGGYNGSIAEQACAEHQVTLRPTTLRGGQGAPDRFGWDKYQWQEDETGQPQAVTCPAGQQATLQPGPKAGWGLARFDPQPCAACPFFQQECRVKAYIHTPPTLHVNQRSIQVARLRQGMSSTNYAIRANVESTIHAFKHPFPAGKLPVRGLVRTHMLVYGSALMVNLRRVHRYLHADEATKLSQTAVLRHFVWFSHLSSAFLAGRNRRRAFFGFNHNLHPQSSALTSF